MNRLYTAGPNEGKKRNLDTLHAECGQERDCLVKREMYSFKLKMQET